MNYKSLSNHKILMRFAIPQMIGLIFNSAYFIVDGIFIGQRLGDQALAAAGVAVPVVEIMIALAMMISVGAGIAVSTALGKQDAKEANTVFNQANSFTLLLAIGIVILGNAFITPLARFLGASDLILADTVLYLRYFITASPFLIFSFSLSTFVRNDNKPKLAMVALIFGAISNIVLDYVFMYPLNMGMAGAALATALGPVFSVLILLPHFVMKRGNLSFEKFSFSIRESLSILQNGISAFITNFSIGLVALIYNIAITANHLGEEGLSSYVVVGYISLIALTAFLGSSQGIQPALSFFKGADDQQRIKELTVTTLKFNLVLSVLFYTCIFFFGNSIIKVFIQDPHLVSVTHGIAKLYFLCLPFAAFNIVLATCLQSINKQLISTLLSLLRCTVPLFLFIIVFPYFWGATGLWLAMCGAEVVTLIPGLRAYRLEFTD